MTIRKALLTLAAGTGSLLLRSVLAPVVFFLRVPVYARSNRERGHYGNNCEMAYS
jgi:hypothetical protein